MKQSSLAAVETPVTALAVTVRDAAVTGEPVMAAAAAGLHERLAALRSGRDA